MYMYKYVVACPARIWKIYKQVQAIVNYSEMVISTCKNKIVMSVINILKCR